MVRKGIGSDARIGSKFLYPGCGYGGSCFPKDVKALARTAQEHGYTMQVIEAVERVNEGQKSILFGKLQRALGDLHGKPSRYGASRSSPKRTTCAKRRHWW